MSHGKRIGYVLKMYPRFSETFIISEILAHEQAGLEIEIFSLRIPAEGLFHESLARVRAPVHYLDPLSLKATDLWEAVRDAEQHLPRLWEALRKATRIDAHEVYQATLIAGAAAQRGIGHLHAHFGTAAAAVARLAADMAGITYSFTAHAKDIYHDEIDPADLRIKLADAGGVVTVSDFNLAHLASTYGEDAARVRRIYNGLDLDEFSFTPPTARDGVILGVGRLIEKKGFDDLVRACAILRDDDVAFTARIVGAGPDEDELRRLIARLGLGDRVDLLGPRPRSEVIRLLRCAQVMAAPCVVGRDGNRDGLPTVLLEAMALGTPCVATDVTGIPEVIRHGRTGILVPQRDPAALARGLRTILEDHAEADRLAREARTLMEREFDIHRNTAVMRRMFAEAAPSRAAPRLEEVAA